MQSGHARTHSSPQHPEVQSSTTGCAMRYVHPHQESLTLLQVPMRGKHKIAESRKPASASHDFRGARYPSLPTAGPSPKPYGSNTYRSKRGVDIPMQHRKDPQTGGLKGPSPLLPYGTQQIPVTLRDAASNIKPVESQCKSTRSTKGLGKSFEQHS